MLQERYLQNADVAASVGALACIASIETGEQLFLWLAG